MTRTELINGLIQKHGFKRYLEIGVNKGANFDRIQCEYKVSVDPDPKCHATFQMTSDEFFDKVARNIHYGFDCIFIDGLHHADQVMKDIVNALFELTPQGFIVCHDMNPQNELFQRVPRETKIWNGDCWKALVKLREDPDLSIVTVDTDEGCAVISRHGKKYPFRLTRELTFENLEKHRKEWLNLMSVEEFKKLYL